MTVKKEEKKNKKKVDIHALKSERTLVLVKPDGVKRGLTGEILTRFEKAGLKIIALKMVWPTSEHFDRHYPGDNAYLENLGGKTLSAYEEYGIDPVEELGTDSKLEIGKMVKGWLVSFMSSGPVVAFIIQGLHAVDSVRAIVGPTLPIFAPPGSIRGDYSFDSPSLANTAKRAVKNLVHASGNVEEAEDEIGLWFAAEEIHDYKRADEDTIY